jgi:pyruvate/2-oxoglutarate dehydrogenase complex dihydrolipoamide acyltransferase (E2) component
MSISQKQANEMIIEISAKTGIDLETLYGIVGNIVKKPNSFASKSAEEYAKTHKIDVFKVKGTSKSGRISMDDLRSYLGQPVTKSPSSLWASKTAKELAEEHGLSENSFGPKDRSGKKRKSGENTITLQDVKKKAGLESPKIKSPWASPQAKEFAKKKGVKAKDLFGSGKSGKITKTDIQKYLNNQKTDCSDSSDSESD